MQIHEIMINNNLIVSIASYKERLTSLDITINSILNNSMLPLHIILNVENTDIDYLKKVKLPDNIIVNICSDNLKSHNKYYYVFQNFVDKCIITMDDDTLYTNDTIESLWVSYLRNKNCVNAIDTNVINIVNDKIQYPYNVVRRNFPSHKNIAIGWAGVLYPPPKEWMKNRNFDKENIMKFISDDDLYLKIVEIENDVKVTHAPLLHSKKYPEMINGIYNNSLALHKINNVDLSRFENIDNEIIEKIKNDK